MKTRSKVVFIVALFLFAACGELPLYEKVFSFENAKWDVDVKPSYSVDIQDVEKEYNFTLSLRTTTDYKYSDLWVFMKTEAPDGTSAREPFQIKITNRDGSWIGNKTGTIVETPLYFKQRKLPLKGIYKFTIEQGITESIVDEVLDLGFRVEEAQAIAAEPQN